MQYKALEFFTCESIMSNKDIRASVVMLECTSKCISTTEPYRILGREKGVGTAFRVDHKYFPSSAPWNTKSTILFLTNWHVVEGCERRRVRIRTTKSPSYCCGEVVHAVPALDFAVVAVKQTEEDETLDPFCSAPTSVLQDIRCVELHVEPLQANQQRIFACGFPMFLEAYVSQGILGSRNSDSCDFWTIDCSVNSGNSGGPVVLEDGRCFGIATAVESEAQQIAYATPISSVLGWFRNHWTKETGIIGHFPRWDFSRLIPRTDAFDKEHGFPTDLDGAIITGLRDTCPFDLRNGDVVVSVNLTRDNVVKLDKFGTATDYEHGEPRFSIVRNAGFICGCSKNTTITVWRPSAKATRKVPCYPSKQLVVEQSNYPEFINPKVAHLGSMVFMQATQDFLQGNGSEDSDDEDHIPPSKTFHILRRVHANRNKAIVVLSHFHEDAYVSSSKTLEKGDIITHIGRTAVKSVQHLDRLIQRLAREFADGNRDRIKITATDKQVWFDLNRLYQEEQLCVAERDASKLWLISEKARVAEEKKKRAAVITRKRTFIPEVLPNSRPGSPVKKRRSSRLRH